MNRILARSMSFLMKCKLKIAPQMWLLILSSCVHWQRQKNLMKLCK
uniref:Uncharacterized protein n=1 Tax=Lotus japonicus TaxID=34305 RepID=I3SKP7_LOTJA|nr:unknown [Lotus japonicus]